MRGNFDVAQLRDALDAVVERHEALRTTFAGGGRKLLQRVHVPHRLPVREIDLSAATDPEAAVHEAVAQELRTRIDPADATVRVTLWRVAADDHVLCVNMHHLVTDSWSCGVLFQDFCAAFEQATSGTVRFAEPGWQYSRFAATQEVELSGGPLRTLQDYWRAKLSGMRLPQLPLAPEQPGRTGRRTALVRADLDGPTTERLRVLARTERTTLFALLLTVYYAQLYRCTDDPDVAVASLFANRGRREVRRTVGFLANMVILRTVLDPLGSFVDGVRATHETVVGGFLNQSLPYQMLPRTAADGAQRADDVVFQMLADPVYSTTVGGVEFEVLVPDGVGSRFEFELVLLPQGSGFRTLLFYDADRIDAGFAEEFVERFTAAAELVAVRPDVSLAELLIVNCAATVV